MTYLLDTNVCIDAMRGHRDVVANLTSRSRDECSVSMVTVFELFSGVERCRNPETEKEKINEFLDSLHLLPFDWDAALEAAKIRWMLESKGQKIGPYDLQIAAHASSLEMILVTHNTKEMDRVRGLKIEDWYIKN